MDFVSESQRCASAAVVVSRTTRRGFAKCGGLTCISISRGGWIRVMEIPVRQQLVVQKIVRDKRYLRRGESGQGCKTCVTIFVLPLCVALPSLFTFLVESVEGRVGTSCSALNPNQYFGKQTIPFLACHSVAHSVHTSLFIRGVARAHLNLFPVSLPHFSPSLSCIVRVAPSTLLHFHSFFSDFYLRLGKNRDPGACSLLCSLFPILWPFYPSRGWSVIRYFHAIPFWSIS
jgi:hypothetical protein